MEVPQTRIRDGIRELPPHPPPPLIDATRRISREQRRRIDVHFARRFVHDRASGDVGVSRSGAGHERANHRRRRRPPIPILPSPPPPGSASLARRRPATEEEAIGSGMKGRGGRRRGTPSFSSSFPPFPREAPLPPLPSDPDLAADALER